MKTPSAPTHPDLPSYSWQPDEPAREPAGFSPTTEWLLTAGNGSFAMGSIDATLRRRYHGLLIASQSPPVQRASLVSAIDECIHIAQDHCCTPELDLHLTRFRFAADKRPPATMPGLVGFEHHAGQSVWTYHLPTQHGAISIRKTLTIADRINAALLTYEIQSPVNASMTLTPLLTLRDFHELNHPGSTSTDTFQASPLDEPAIAGVRVTRNKLGVNLRGVQLHWHHDPSLYHNIRLDSETERGQPDTEDLYAPGHWRVEITKGVSQTIQIELADASTVSTASIQTIDWNTNIERRTTRIRSSIDCALASAGNPSDPHLRQAIAMLAQASDAFVVSRGVTKRRSTSIIAGYPWFSDWGRDTMISLPGLLLVTGRHDEALDTLTTFANARHHGLIPNRFDDRDGPAHYNTVDASLWFIHACAQWCTATSNPIPKALDDACADILSAYARGTTHNIAVDPGDGLVKAGSEATQLTWMDAQRGGITFTPRHGKPIEIQALWINALRAYADLINTDRPTHAAAYRAQADHAQSSLLAEMTLGPSRGLVDCLVPHNHTRALHWERSTDLRPNQVFALSLPRVQLPLAVRTDSIHAIWTELLTPAGLRTLAPDDPDYQPRYTGTLMDRDRAYHNGTVWPWLLGPACEALLRTRSFDDHSRATTIELLTNLASNMTTDSVGQLHEICDADADPVTERHRPDGCPAQAWSIAETLRVLVLASNPAQ